MYRCVIIPSASSNLKKRFSVPLSIGFTSPVLGSFFFHLCIKNPNEANTSPGFSFTNSESTTRVVSSHAAINSKSNQYFNRSASCQIQCLAIALSSLIHPGIIIHFLKYTFVNCRLPLNTAHIPGFGSLNVKSSTRPNLRKLPQRSTTQLVLPSLGRIALPHI